VPSRDACDACLHRTALLGLLAPWVEAAKRRLPEVLALPDAELIAGLCGNKRAAVDKPLAAFEPAAARARAAELGVSVMCRHAARYPGPLAQMADAPAVLHWIGDVALLDRAVADGAVAIVGSRRASTYGAETAVALARDLAACDVPVVSGLAYGVDAAAHAGALSANGPTIAVMPGGADVAYPKAKRNLHERIKSDGLVIAEMPPGARPFRWSFPARNRIMAALTRMTVVVEAAEGSGSLITAGFAQDLGRDVGAVPGRVTSRLAAGPNRLLSEGAAVVRSAADVLDALYGPEGRPPREPAAAVAAAAVRAGRPAIPARLAPRLRRLLDRMDKRPGTVEALAGSDEVADVLAGLSELELMGLVVRGPGGDYVRRA
jgi:DNA processing protein